MKPFPIKTSKLAAGVALAYVLVSLSGCLNLSGFTQMYGHATPDDDPVRADGKPTYIPPNAPSIHNS